MPQQDSTARQNQGHVKNEDSNQGKNPAARGFGKSPDEEKSQGFAPGNEAEGVLNPDETEMDEDEEGISPGRVSNPEEQTDEDSQRETNV